MENNLISPNKLWADFDADSVHLRANFLKYDTDENGVVDFEVYLSGDQLEDNSSILTYCYGKIPKKDSKNATLIYISGYKADNHEDMFDMFIPKGYSVICFDYMGKTNKRKHTIYPQSLNFANYSESKGHLNCFVNSPKDSCVFVWSKVCRNVITFVKRLLGKDNKIYMRSSLEGGNILWQVAGMDKRVDGIIAANNAGWEESRGIFRYSESPDEYDFSEDKIKWMSACSPQAYAKFVTCPVLYISGTNSRITSIDRVEKTLSLTRNDGQNHICLCANLSNTVNALAQTSMTVWLDKINQNKPIPTAPKTSFEVNDGKLYAKMEYDTSQEIDKIFIYHSYDEINSELRHWNRNILSLAHSAVEIPVRTGDSRIFAFASVYYKDGQFYSSLPIMFDLKKAKVVEVAPKRSHIIFEKKNGLNAWVVDNSYGENSAPEFRAGAYDIMGVTSKNGHLSTYSISDKNFQHTDSSIFQFDCYAEKARSLTVEMLVETNLFEYEKYRIDVQLNGKEWQKIALSHNDFKTKDLVPLKNWNKVKQLSFKNIDGALISNIIWI